MGCFGSKFATEWDDYDWKELPDNIKEAAKKLGYSKSKGLALSILLLTHSLSL